MLAERAREEEAQRRSESVLAEERALPALLEEQRRRAEEEAQVLSSQSEKLQAVEQQKRARLATLEQALHLYRDRLGLCFEQGIWEWRSYSVLKICSSCNSITSWCEGLR